MSNEQKHVAGPIACISTSNHAHDYRLTNPDGTPINVSAPSNDHSEQRATAARLEDCYNACAGMDDPAKFIAAQSADVAQLQAQAFADEARIAELLAALNGLNHMGGDERGGFCCCPANDGSLPNEKHSTACASARDALANAGAA